jgi:predicted nucleic acid-binding protein
MIKYFFDTYAIIEYLKGNKQYRKYFKKDLGITTKLNLMELYYSYIDNEDFADEVYNSYLSIAVEITDDQIKKAMRLRKDLKDKRLDISYVDAIGYHLSFEMGIRFLTGDREFSSLPNVEFIK